MASGTLLIVRTARRHYAVARADIADMRMLADAAALQAEGCFGRPCVTAELGPLLDPADQSGMRRRHALLVPLRRRYVALLVDAIETFLEQYISAPLPALLHEKLRQPWAVAALHTNGLPVVQLDLRAVARSVLQQPAPSQ